MKILYWLSFIPTAPFFALSWIAYGIAWITNYVGCIIHDETTLRLWNVLHARKCAQLNNQKKGTT